MRDFTNAELVLLIDGLAFAANSHESQARKVKFSKQYHRDAAAKIRVLRAELMKILEDVIDGDAT